MTDFRADKALSFLPCETHDTHSIKEFHIRNRNKGCYEHSNVYYISGGNVYA